MRSIYKYCIGLLLLTTSAKAQYFQFNMGTGVNAQLLNLDLSGVKTGFGVDWIFRSDSTFMVFIDVDIFFSRKGELSQQLYSFKTNAPAAVYNDIKFDLRHFAFTWGASKYVFGSPFSSKAIYLSVGIRLDNFTLDNIQYSPYNDTLYYFNEFFSHRPGDVGYTFGNTDWQSFGLQLGAGYLHRWKQFNLKPSANLGFYFGHYDSYSDMKKSSVFMGLNFAVGYLFKKRVNEKYRLL